MGKDTVRVKVLATSVSWRDEGNDKTQHADEGDVVDMPKGEFDRIMAIDAPAAMLEETDEDLLDASSNDRMTLSAIRAAESIASEAVAEGAVTKDSVILAAAAEVDKGTEPAEALAEAGDDAAKEADKAAEAAAEEDDPNGPTVEAQRAAEALLAETAQPGDAETLGTPAERVEEAVAEEEPKKAAPKKTAPAKKSGSTASPTKAAARGSRAASSSSSSKK